MTSVFEVLHQILKVMLTMRMTYYLVLFTLNYCIVPAVGQGTTVTRAQPKTVATTTEDDTDDGNTDDGDTVNIAGELKDQCVFIPPHHNKIDTDLKIQNWLVKYPLTSKQTIKYKHKQVKLPPKMDIMHLALCKLNLQPLKWNGVKWFSEFLFRRALNCFTEQIMHYS